MRLSAAVGKEGRDLVLRKKHDCMPGEREKLAQSRLR